MRDSSVPASHFRRRPSRHAPADMATGAASDEQPPIRVLHCPDNVGAHPAQLAAAERAIGLESWCVTMRPHPFGYDADEVVWHEPPGALRKVSDRLRLVWRALRHF